MFIVGGILGCVAFGLWVEKTKKFKTAINIICFSATTFVFSEFFLFKLGNVWLCYMLTFCQGFVSLPIMAVTFDFGVEITYPIGESFSTGVLMSAGCVFGIIFTLISSELLQHMGADGGTWSFLFMSIACLIGSIFSLLVKNDLRR